MKINSEKIKKFKVQTSSLSSKKLKLEKERESLQTNYRNRAVWNIIWGILIAICIYLFFYQKFNIIILAIAIILGILGLIANLGNNSTDRKKEVDILFEIANIEDRIFADEIKNVQPEERALRQLSKSQINLEKYDQLSYEQVRKIFIIGKNMSYIGLLIIISIIFISFYSNSLLPNIVAIGGLVSGVLVNFIGSVFILMYSKTLKTANMNHYVMIETNQAYLGNVLATQIQSRELREQTLSEMANKLISKEKNINFNE